MEFKGTESPQAMARAMRQAGSEDLKDIALIMLETVGVGSELPTQEACDRLLRYIQGVGKHLIPPNELNEFSANALGQLYALREGLRGAYEDGEDMKNKLSKVRAFANRVIRHEAQNYLRALIRRRRLVICLREVPDIPTVEVGTGQSEELLADLSPRERHIAQLIADGCSQSVVAETLQIDRKTVYNTLRRIAQRLRSSI